MLPANHRHLFLCHSNKDKKFVRRLAADLQCFEAHAWFDEWEMTAGDSLHERIGHALELSSYVAVVMSQDWLESGWCQKELRQALSREMRQGGKVVIPIRYKDIAIPAFLEDKLYLDFGQSYMESLARLVGLIHGVDPASLSRCLAATKVKQIEDVRAVLIGAGCDVVQAIIDRRSLDRVYFALAYRVGLFQAQTLRGAIEAIHLTYTQTPPGIDTRTILRCFASGLLEARTPLSTIGEDAIHHLASRGVAFTHQSADLRNTRPYSFQVDAICGDGPVITIGEVHRHRLVRMVRWRGFDVEIDLDGSLFICSHIDAPGIVGFVGTILGMEGVDVIQHNTGQDQSGRVVKIFKLNKPPSEECLRTIHGHPAISESLVVALPAPTVHPAWL